MSKISPTPIDPYVFVHRTNKLYIILSGVVLWTLLTTALTVLAINSKYFHNTYQCEGVTVQPIKTLTTPIDHKQSRLITKISTMYKVPKQEVYQILGIVKSYTEHHRFPTTSVVLALIATESAFSKYAVSSANAQGYMQVLATSGKPVTTETWQNIKSGTELLRDYRQQLGSDYAAIQAYNIGIGSYLKGQRAPEYLQKVKNNLKLLESV